MLCRDIEFSATIYCTCIDHVYVLQVIAKKVYQTWEACVCGFIAQLVEHRTGIAEVMGSNPVEALIFFRLLLSSCLNWKIHCDDHTSLSSHTAV